MPITGSELTLGARALAALRRIARRPDPVDVLKRRAEVREEIRQNLERPQDGVPEVLVVKHNKYDTYGEIDNRVLGRGASNWFKAEVKGLHDRGLEVYAAIEYVTIRRGRAYRTRVSPPPPGSRKVWVTGRIAYRAHRIHRLDA